ncbi:hypothetical protein LCGC14_2029450 [marine sediment metagenome]|uniref:Uncharacterized protein n=1 Tax=marine sediment metagenome TaxID=412755 RepID=A0A0F9HS98_9ZZZZ
MFTDNIIVILAVGSILLLGEWVFLKLWGIGGRNEFEELRDAQEDFDKLRKDLFD